MLSLMVERMKLKQLQKEMRKRKISAVVFLNRSFTPDPNFYYLTQYEGSGILVVPQKRPVLIVPLMEAERARIAVKGSGIRVAVGGKKKGLFGVMKKQVRGKVVGIDKGAVTLHMLASLRKALKGKRFADISKVMAELRSVKADAEITNIRTACRISDRILKKCFSRFRTFRTEKDVAVFLEAEALREGCPLSFPVIVASGKNASQPHYLPKDILLKKGFCIIDFGIKYRGYCSDTTRTVSIGRPSATEQELYKTVLEAQQRGVDACRAGVRAGSVVTTVNRCLGRHARYFIHGLGHGVGVEIHEHPNLKTGSADLLRRGMAFTIEPGVYCKGRYGIRIEDTVALGKNPVILTKIPKDLLIMQEHRR